MERGPQLRLMSQTGVSRRAFFAMPAVLAGWLLYVERPRRKLPDPAIDGNGQPITLVLFSDAGVRERAATVRKLVRSEAEWRRILAPDEYAVARRAVTEPPFTGRYWNAHAAGISLNLRRAGKRGLIYRCTCCGNALFDARAQFDSGTGWPSFTEPVAIENIYSQADRTLAEVRQEVLCSKCDAHLGHVFPDGPPPTGQRYCLNSAALRLCEAGVPAGLSRCCWAVLCYGEPGSKG